MKGRARDAAVTWIVLLTPLVLMGSLLMGPAGLGLPEQGTEAGQAVLLLRLTRVAAGFLVGACLSAAGVVFQSLLRNPLADPYVLGVSSGAGLGAAVMILCGLGAVSAFAVPVSAFVFGTATLGIVCALARRGGVTSMYSLILSGVIVSSVCSSLLMFLISMASREGLHDVMWWMLGNLQVAAPALLAVSGVLAGGGILGLWLLSRELDALTLGPEMAHHLGVRTRVAIGLGLALATLVTGAAVGTAGLIGFVGLVVPHVVRGLVGASHRRLLPCAALGGGAFLTLCDALARTVLSPMEIPVGVVTALVGGPFFLYLLRRKRSQEWIG